MDVQLPLLGRINLENLVENVKAGEVKSKKVSKKLLSIEKTLVRQAPVVLVQKVTKGEVYALCSNID